MTRSSDLMVVATGVVDLSLSDYYIYLARQMHDPGNIRSGKPWPSGSRAPFLSPQGVDQGGSVWPNISL